MGLTDCAPCVIVGYYFEWYHWGAQGGDSKKNCSHLASGGVALQWTCLTMQRDLDWDLNWWGVLDRWWCGRLLSFGVRNSQFGYSVTPKERSVNLTVTRGWGCRQFPHANAECFIRTGTNNVDGPRHDTWTSHPRLNAPNVSCCEQKSGDIAVQRLRC